MQRAVARSPQQLEGKTFKHVWDMLLYFLFSIRQEMHEYFDMAILHVHVICSCIVAHKLVLGLGKRAQIFFSSACRILEIRGNIAGR